MSTVNALLRTAATPPFLIAVEWTKLSPESPFEAPSCMYARVTLLVNVPWPLTVATYRPLPMTPGTESTQVLQLATTGYPVPLPPLELSLLLDDDAPVGLGIVRCPRLPPFATSLMTLETETEGPTLVEEFAQLSPLNLLVTPPVIQLP